MQLLFGDSTPFPLDYDVLETTRQFARCLAAAGPAFGDLIDLRHRADRELAKQRDRVASRVAFLDRVLEDLTVHAAPFGEVVEDDVQRTLTYLASAIERAKKEYSDETARSWGQLEPERERLDRAVWSAVAEFLRSSGLPMQECSVRQSIAGSGNDVRIELSLLAGLTIEGRLESAPGPFSKPCTVGDLLPAVHVQTGTRRKTFGRTRVEVIECLDRYLITSMTLTAKEASLHLRSERNKPALLLQIDRAEDTEGRTPSGGVRRDQGRLRARVESIEDGEKCYFGVSDEHMKSIQRLWQRLDLERTRLAKAPCKVVSSELHGEPLKGAQSLVRLLDHFATELSPVLLEIAERSPARDELSLKCALKDGSRRELYLPRGELQFAHDRLPDALRDLLPFPARKLWASEAGSGSARAALTGTPNRSLLAEPDTTQEDFLETVC